MLNLQETVHAEWGRDRKSVISILSLDVSKAFNRVSHQRLLHNLRKRRIPELLANWVKSFLEDRRTAFRIGSYTSPQRDAQVGIPQGSPLSPILYLFYNADLIEGCRQARNNAAVVGFVDDTNIIVYGESDVGNCQRLQGVHKFCDRWARKHGSQFNAKKYQLLHMAKTRRVLQAALKIGEVEVVPEKTLKFLGVHLDKMMSGKAQVKAIQEKLPSLVAALRTLSGSVWGASLARCRQIYRQAIRPTLTYGAVSWFKSEDVIKSGKGMAAKTQIMQGQCLRAVAGAYKATSTEALEAEIGVEPLDLYLGKLAAITAIRNALSEAGKGTKQRIQAIASRQRKGRRRRTRNEARASPLEKMVTWVGKKSGVKIQSDGASAETRREGAKATLAEVKKFIRKHYKEK